MDNINQSRKIAWASPSKRQNWSFPAPIIRYIAMNPSSKEVYLKLIKTCKYFFEANPVIIAKRMRNEYLCDRRHCPRTSRCPKCVRVDYNKLDCRIWLTTSVKVAPINDEILLDFNLGEVCDKIYQSEVRDVYLTARECITMEQFKRLAGTTKGLYISNTCIHDVTGAPSKVDEIIAVLPRLKDVLICCNEYTVDPLTPQKLQMLENLQNIQRLELHYVTRILDINLLTHLINDTSITTSIIIIFEDDELNPGYQDALNHLLVSIIETPIPNRVILYNGL